jgi:hypothetical protein
MRGRVVDGDNDRPLRRAIVSVFLPRDDDATRPVLTDEDGTFAIELADPSSAIVITKAGYASVVIEPDRRSPLRDLDVRLARGAVISGRVIEQGLPAIGARKPTTSANTASAVCPPGDTRFQPSTPYRPCAPVLSTRPVKPCRESSRVVEPSSPASFPVEPLRHASAMFAPDRKRAT